MKYIKILSLLFIIAIFANCTPKIGKAIKKIDPELVEKLAKDGKTVMLIEEPFYNFGDVKFGDTRKRTFKFKNVGKADLIIEFAAGSCGCTLVTDFPQNIAIKPGEGGEIKVLFDSGKKKVGLALTDVTIVTNTEIGIEEIKLEANITK